MRTLHPERPLSGPKNIPTLIPKALPWADRTGPTGRKIGILKRRCSKNPCLKCMIAQLLNLRCGLAQRPYREGFTMSAILENVKAAAIQLSPAEQSELIDFLEDSNSIRAAWESESRRRFAEMESGGVVGVSVDDVFRANALRDGVAVTRRRFLSERSCFQGESDL